MAKHIGGISCSLVKGTAQRPKQRVDVWEVPGHDGFGAMRTGLGDSPFRFLGIEFGTEGALETWAASIEDLQGTVITVENDWGRTYTDCMVLRVRRRPPTANVPLTGRAEVLVEGLVQPA